MKHTTNLPTDRCFDPIERYEALGFSFGEVDASDPALQEATLPEGWARQETDLPGCSYIVDERGLNRVELGAFNDGSRWMNFADTGGDVVWRVIDGVSESVPWDLLTDEEREAAVDTIKDFVAECDQHPDDYETDKADRARALLASVPQAP